MVADSFAIMTFESSARSFAAQVSGLPDDIRKRILDAFYEELEKRDREKSANFSIAIMKGK